MVIVANDTVISSNNDNTIFAGATDNSIKFTHFSIHAHLR